MLLSITLVLLFAVLATPARAEPPASLTAGERALRIANETVGGAVGWVVGALGGSMIGLALGNAFCNDAEGNQLRCLSRIAVPFPLALTPIGTGIGVSLASPAPWYAAVLGTVPGGLVFFVWMTQTEDDNALNTAILSSGALMVVGSVLTVELWPTTEASDPGSARLGLLATPQVIGLSLAITDG